MHHKRIDIKRPALELKPNPKRVIIKPFVPGDSTRIKSILNRIMTTPEGDIKELLGQVLSDFAKRHRNVRQIFENRFKELERFLPADSTVSAERRMLIGAYFLCEYSLEAAALFNPSIVPHWDQSGLPPGSLRFIMSLRATGEGHISSVEFRTGVIDGQAEMSIDNEGQYVTLPQLMSDPIWGKKDLIDKLKDMGCLNSPVKQFLRPLRARFSRLQLEAQMKRHAKKHRKLSRDLKRAMQAIKWLMESNYELRFSNEDLISEKALFPMSADERNGIEDARFVPFVDNKGKVTYYATYTAYDGHSIMPKMLETTDFTAFRSTTLTGKAVQNKGMALFPRKIDDRYVMISRLDGENLYIMLSDNAYRWNDFQKLLTPTQPWEFTQIGNCGSPIETEKGWILLTHGVGPLRKYCIGAVLLDRKDPAKIIGQLKSPLIEPNELERAGYVPNVVYTCGALVHQEMLIIPYAMSDYAVRLAIISLDKLFQHFQ